MTVTIITCSSILACLLLIGRIVVPVQDRTPDPRIGRTALAVGCMGVLAYYVVRLLQAFITDPGLLILSIRAEALAVIAFLGCLCFAFHVLARTPWTPTLRDWLAHGQRESRADLYGFLLLLGFAALLVMVTPMRLSDGWLPAQFPPGVQLALAAVLLPLIAWLGLIGVAIGRQPKMSPMARRRVRFIIACVVLWLTNKALCEVFLAPMWTGWIDVSLIVDSALFGCMAVVITARRGNFQIVEAIDKFAADYLLGSMDEAMVAVDEHGVVRAVNLPAAEIIGAGADAIVGRSARDLLTRDRFQLADPDRWHGVPSPEARVMQFPAADGTIRYLASRISTLTDTLGNDVGRVEILQDITAHREAQERLWQYSHQLEERIAEGSRALADSETRYRGLVEHLGDCLLIVQDGAVRFANPAAERLWAHAGVPVIGTNVDELWDTGVTSAWSAVRTQLAEHPKAPWRGEMEWRAGADPVREFLVTASTARWDDGPAILLVGTDNTERRELQTSLDRVRRLQALGTLTGGIAHDFNNYLTSILGRLTMLQEVVAEDPAAQAQIAGALGAAEKGQALIARLMRFSRPEDTGRQPTDVCQLLRDTSPLLESLLREEIRLEWHLPPDPLWVHADPAAIQEILLNLAKNAEDAMWNRAGVVLISVRVPEGAATSTAEIRVTDTGPGITPEVGERIFEPFFTTKPVGQGHGLGLALAHQIMQEHGGKIAVESTPGRGATFTLTLPRCPAPAAEDGPPTTALVRGQGELILVVDDDADVRQTACDMLTRLGYRIVTAEDGQVALDVVEREPAVTAVLMDLVMPRLNGVDCALELKARGFTAPIVFMTGYDPDPQRLRQLGANVVAMRKPFRLKELSAVLRDEIAAARTLA